MKRTFKETLAWILCVSMISGSGGAGIAGGLTTWAAVPVESVGNVASGSNAEKQLEMPDESGVSSVLATAGNAGKNQDTSSAEVEEIYLATASDTLYAHRYLTPDGMEILIGTTDSIWSDDTVVKVEKVTGTKQEQITDLVEKAMPKDQGKVSEVYAYDISFWSDGEEFEPDGNVEITFRFPEKEKERFQGNAKIFHVKDEAKYAEIMPNETETEEEVSCLADGFSVYGVVLTEIDYVPIYTADDLQNMKEYKTASKFKLMNDIDLAGYDWEPFSLSEIYQTTEPHIVQVEFDGNGYAIKNLKIVIGSRVLYCGLFTSLRRAKVCNVKLENMYIQDTDSNVRWQDVRAIGGLCGEAAGAEIVNCEVSGEIVSNHSRNVAGIAGLTIDSDFYNCSSDVNISASHTAAGISTCNEANNHYFEKCKNLGTISAINAGGISARGYSSEYYVPSGKIVNCINRGAINGISAGGIIGGDNIEFAVLSCLNEGTITGTGWSVGNGFYEIGGIVSELSGNIEQCYNSGIVTFNDNTADNIGGIAGQVWPDAQVTDCYNCGTVFVPKDRFCQNIGGIAGSLWGESNSTVTAKIVRSYNAGKVFVEGQEQYESAIAPSRTGKRIDCYALEYEYKYFDASDDGLRILSDSDMRKAESFPAFDFTQIWAMGDEKYPYPIFQWQTEEPDVPYPPGDESDILSIKDCSPWKDTSLYQNSDIEIVFNRDIYEIPGENCEDRFEIRDYMSDTPFFQWNPEFKNYSIDGNVLTLYDALLNCTPGIMYYLHIPDGFFKSASDETDELTNCEDKGRFNFVLGFRDSIDSHFVEFKYKKDNKTILYFFKEIKDGELCQSAEPPVWNGYKFVDWYVDEYYSKPFDFTTPIHKNYSLYGKFIPDSNAYTESDSDGSSSQNIYSTNVRDSGFVNIHDPKTGESLWQCVQNGRPITGYVEILYYNGIPGSFLFDENGFMLTGWQNVNGELCYFDETFGHRGYEIKANDLTNMLNRKSAFGTLNSYQLAGTFAGDLNFLDATNFLIVNYGEVNTLVRKWILSGEDRTKANEDWTRNYLKQIVNNLCDSQKRGAYFAINDANMRSSRTQMGILANLVKGTEYGSVAEMYEYLEKATGYAEEVLDGMFANYTSNICMLDKYAEICPEMRSVIQELKAEYTHSVSLNLKKTMIDKIVDEFGVKNIVNTYKNISGKTSGAGDILSAYSASNKAIESMISTLFVQTLQQNVKDLSTVSNVENVIYSAYTRTQVLNALKRAEEDLKGNPNQKDALNNYVTAFEIAKEANKIQYWNMYEYYGRRGDTEKANLAYEGYRKLNNMSFNNY